MKTLVCIAPGNFRYDFADKPKLLTDTAIIKIKRIGICGTDLHAYEGTQPYFTYPRILGHELAGELVSFDNAPGFSLGEAVTFIPYFNCGACIACNKGKPNCCVNLKVCGVHIDGGMVEYLRVASGALVHGDGLSYDELALVEPLAIGAHGVSRAGVKAGEFVLVIGAGPIGLGTIEFTRIAGGEVIVVDVDDNRLKFCNNELKVIHTINPAKENAIERVKEITGNEMASVVIDATGNLNAINGGINYLAHGGRFVLIGLQKEAFSFSHPEFHKREATLMSSRNATREDFENVKNCLKENLIKARSFITHQTTFDQVKDEFESWLDPSNGVIKAMVTMEG
jgi:2-desacetyl-2-hydroxyethyl bacteriochlorophyllide A dehydrogenase